MDRDTFALVYLHANALAELGFQHGLAQVMAAPPPELDAAQQAELQAMAQKMANPDPDSFDWSALEGVTGFDADASADQEPAAPTGPGPVDAAVVPFFGDVVGREEDDPAAGPADVADYLRRALAARETLGPRIDNCFERVDLAALEALVASTPAPRLSEPLAPEQFAAWLQRYRDDDEATLALVAAIRELEPLF